MLRPFLKRIGSYLRRGRPAHATPPANRQAPFRPRVESLEDRVHPGDTLGGLLWGLPPLGVAAFLPDPGLPPAVEAPSSDAPVSINTAPVADSTAPPPPLPSASQAAAAQEDVVPSTDTGATVTLPATSSTDLTDGLAALFGSQNAPPATPGAMPGSVPNQAPTGGIADSGSASAPGGGSGGGASAGPAPTAPADANGIPPAATPATANPAMPSSTAGAPQAPRPPQANPAATNPAPFPLEAKPTIAAPTPAPAAQAPLPLTFEANQGQTDPQVGYLAHAAGYTVYLTHSGQAVFDLQQPLAPGSDPSADIQGAAVRMDLVGASPNPQAVALDPQAGHANYFLGNDPSQWVTDVATFGKVDFQNVYPGIDLEYFSTTSGQLEYDFIVHPGADLTAIQLAFTGADSVGADGEGGLNLATAAGALDQHAPILYQSQADGTQAPVTGGFQVAQGGQVGFQVGSYNPAQDLVIDPALSSTYLAGSGNDQALAVATDGHGYSYITGLTTSTNFPTTPGAYKTTSSGGQVAFVAKLSPGQSSASYVTYLGANSSQGNAIAIDASGDAFIAGQTSSSSFPTTSGAYLTTFVPGTDAFLTELNSSGSALGYSTFLAAGSQQNPAQTGANSVTLDSSGNAYVAGAGAVPTTSGAIQTSANGKAFVTKFNSTGSNLTFSTGLGTATARGIALDSSNEPVITGDTTSASFPTTTGAWQTSNQGGDDGFLVKLNSSGTAEVLGTYVGGSGADQSNAVALDSSGNIYIAGQTASSNFPVTSGAYQTTLGGGTDAFAAEVSASGAPLYATYLGGSGNDAALGLALTAAGEAVLAGLTASSNFPTVNAPQVAGNGQGVQAFVAKLAPGGKALEQASFFSGQGMDQANGIALDPLGAAYLAGATTKGTIPATSWGFQNSASPVNHAFVAKLDISPLPPAFVPALAASGLIATAPGSDGGDPAALGFSAAGVRYADGAVQLSASDLTSDGFGTSWGQQRSWSSAAGYAGKTLNGNGVVNSQLPYLLASNGTNTLVAVTSATDSRYFDWSGSAYQERNFLPDKLVYNSSGGEYVLTDSTGAQIRFNDFANSRAPLQRGLFKSYTDPYANVTQVTSWTSDGLPAEVQRTGGGVTESFLYTYGTSGSSLNQLTNVTLRRQVSGVWSTIRQAVYAYYDGSTSFGNPGDLQSATIEDASGNAIDTWYYRYYQAGASGGYAGGVKYVFGPDAYRRLANAFSNPLTATDTQVAPYADGYYQYDSSQHVTQAVIAGDGSTEGSGTGLGTYTYSYSTSTNAAGYNSWATKTVETLPDGNQNIIYTNAYGEVMLAVYQDATSGLKWDTYYQYDSAGRLILQAQPSAVTGYSDSYADLVNGGSYLAASAGLIIKFTYATSTTATETTAGNVSGYLQQDAVEQGTGGTAIVTDSTLYFQHTGSNITIDPVASTTAYRNTDGTGAETTSDAYTYASGGPGIVQDTTTPPVISAAQNGPGTADTSISVRDGYGRVIWTKNADGFMNYMAYDNATGAVTKTITDVDTTRTGDFSNLPSGWSTPTGGGLHLITQFVVDGLGRPTKITDPAGNVTYMVYKDTNHEVRTYRGWNSSTGAPTGPTEVQRDDLSGTYSESLTMTAGPHLTNGAPDGTEAIGSVVTLARSLVNNAGQVIYTDRYYSLGGLTYSTAQTLGTENTNYYRTRLAFDSRGRQDRELAATGTISRTVFDRLDRIISTWLGTNDTPTSGIWSPTNNTGSANMVQITGSVYDGGGVGDGDLTQQNAYPGGSAATRTTQDYYDWRDRLVATKDGVQASENTTVGRPIVFYDLDNLGEITATSLFDGDNVNITTTGGVPQKPSASLLRAYSTTAVDDQERPYQTKVFSVDPSSGNISTNALTTNEFYDHRGDTIETASPGGAVTKDQFDGAGRITIEFTTDGAGGSTWANAGSVTGDNVLDQVENTYDAASNVILVTTRQRFDNETATGSLGNATNSPKARVSYIASWYDAGNRPTATAHVGTNGGSAYSRPSTAPASSDTVLVNTLTYNGAGWQDTSTDPRGIVHKDFYDNLARVIKSVDAYTGGNVSATSDKTTEMTYDGDNNLVTVQADQPGGGAEVTKYLLGVTTSAGSDVNSNDFASATQLPDPTTGQPSSSQQENYTVNALGETKTVTDRNGNVHTLTYDVLGRQTSDTVTTLGSAVDGSVRRIDTAYDTQGNPYLFTSYADTAGTTIVNQVQDSFNGLGQLTNEYQSHSGAVNTSTTPQVQYGYTLMSGGQNNSRLVSMTYPNGRVLNYNYASGVDSAVSRLTSISDNSGTLEAYTYLGAGTVVKRAHPLVGMDLTYIKQSGESNGDAGDQYTGLDRFGRVVDQRWLIAASGVAVERLQYGYDRNSNPLYRSNLVNHNYDELYHASGAGNGYDNLNQLSAFLRGVLSSSTQGGPLDTVSSPSHSQTFSPDAQGNFASVTTDGTQVNRTNNQQNEVTAVGSANLTFDANGNMTTDERAQTLVYDAWNRLVQVKDSGGNVLSSYKYDALGRRTQETSGGVTRDLYLSTASQVLEEQVNGQAQVQNVWSPVYVNALIERDRDPTGSGTLSERLWVVQDANWNVIALVNGSGQVVEQYLYDPFGKVTVLDGNGNVLSGSAYAWRYTFQGGRFDPATGYLRFGIRDLSPTLARWAEPDPTHQLGSGPNDYWFGANDPAGRTDPSGLTPTVIPTVVDVTETRIVAAQRALEQALGPRVRELWATPAALRRIAEEIVRLPPPFFTPDYFRRVAAALPGRTPGNLDIEGINTLPRQQQWRQDLEEASQMTRTPAAARVEARQSQEFLMDLQVVSLALPVGRVISLLRSGATRLWGRLFARAAAAAPARVTGQIGYGSSNLSRAAQAYRQTQGVTGGRNVAVFEYRAADGSLQTITRASTRGVGHAERIIARELQGMGVKRSQVTRIYSELQPCNVPGGYCDPFIRRTFPHAEVSWSFEYGATAESRAAGVEALRRAAENLGR
jgi:RHS repeat-associated protein